MLSPMWYGTRNASDTTLIAKDAFTNDGSARYLEIRSCQEIMGSCHD